MITYIYCSRRNYTRAELAGKRYALDSPARQSMRSQRLNVTYRLGIESPAGYITYMSVSVEHTQYNKEVIDD